MKYCFEKYEFSERGRIFLGYESINSESAEEAKSILQEKLGEDITLLQIYINQN